MQYKTPDGRIFTHVGYEPYTRKNGTHTHLSVWQAPCARPGCTGFCTIKVPADYPPEQHKAFGTKHCQEHKMTSAEFLRAGQLARRRLTKAVIRELQDLHARGHSYDTLALVFPFTPGTIREIIKGRRT